MKEAFIEKRFSRQSKAIIEAANTIIGEYQAQGYSLTLRQLYYQFVSRDIIQNNMKEYKRLGSVVNNARLAGLIDWAAIEDRDRQLNTWLHYANPAQALERLKRQYRINLWARQPYYIEVWVEKTALIGVVERVCSEWRVPYLACKGYASQSALYDAGKRFALKANEGKQCLMLHLGDHDPSGLDMTRDNRVRAEMFSNLGYGTDELEVVRLALNMEQVEEYDPPPNPAKDTDTRSSEYKAEHGESSWELDALEPSVIRDLISEAIDARVDRDIWEADEERENAETDQLQGYVDEAKKGLK